MPKLTTEELILKELKTMSADLRVIRGILEGFASQTKPQTGKGIEPGVVSRETVSKQLTSKIMGL